MRQFRRIPLVLLAGLAALWAAAGNASAQTATTRAEQPPAATSQRKGIAYATEPLPPLPSGAFTIVIIPDTQAYRGQGTKYDLASKLPVTNEHLAQHVRWIRQHVQDQNIVFVSHVGDIVDINRPAEWAVAKEHLDGLRGIVPFGLVVGNHDMTNAGDAALFQEFFPAESFRAYPWYLGCYQHDRPDQKVSANNVNSAQVFTAGGLDFLFLHLECNAPDDVLAWADTLLADHKHRHALVTTHMDLGILDKPRTQDGFIHDPKGRMRWVKIHGQRGNTAEQMWDKLFRRHANIGFIFSGDQSRVTALRLASQGDAGNTVQAMLSDYMSTSVLRLMRFVPAENQVHVVTYDTLLDKLVVAMPYVPDRDQHQYSVAYPMAESRQPRP